ncbi:MAG: hypothetical protein R2705_23050 [Ilumatobacteraceae bacterium]
MSISGPSDLAIAFRSLSRRVAGAMEPLDDERHVVAAELDQLDAIIREAGSVVGSSGVSEAVADALETRPADSWQAGQIKLESTFCALRRRTGDPRHRQQTERHAERR